MTRAARLVLSRRTETDGSAHQRNDEACFAFAEDLLKFSVQTHYGICADSQSLQPYVAQRFVVYSLQFPTVFARRTGKQVGKCHIVADDGRCAHYSDIAFYATVFNLVGCGNYNIHIDTVWILFICYCSNEQIHIILCS